MGVEDSGRDFGRRRKLGRGSEYAEGNDGVEQGMVTEEDWWLASDEGTEWVLRTVDEILEGVESSDEAQNMPKAKL